MTFSDARISICLNNIFLNINGIDVTASVATSSTSIVYSASGLTDGDVAIDLTVADAAGNTDAESWMFNMNITLQF